MPRLLDLPTELLENIWKYVSRNDIDSFVSSCKRLHSLARADRLIEHRMAKARLTRIETSWSTFELYEFPQLLQSFLLAPDMADYVKEMLIDGWVGCWDESYEHMIRYPWLSRPLWPMSDFRGRYDPYSESMMRELEIAIKSTNLISSEEKEFWISETKDGNQNPIIALLLPRLHYLTRLVIILRFCKDLFLLETLQRIAKDQNSPSLSRLREVELVGRAKPTHSIKLATACAALPSIISLSAKGLVEGPLEPAWPSYDWPKRFSNVRNLRVNDWRLSQTMLFTLIGTAKSLRSFTYICTRSKTYRPIAWARAALLQYASPSLEELALHCPVGKQKWSTECSFRSYQNLRVLTIDYRLLMGEHYQARNKIVTLLPASIETLNLHGCSVFDDDKWVRDLVKWVARVKSRLVPCLKELNFMVTSFLYYYATYQMLNLCANGMEAGITVTFTPDGELEYPD